jgi:hypothetical protein
VVREGITCLEVTLPPTFLSDCWGLPPPPWTKCEAGGTVRFAGPSAEKTIKLKAIKDLGLAGRP